MKKIALYSIVVLLIFIALRFAWLRITAPPYLTVDRPPIDPTGEPEQLAVTDAPTIPLSFKDGEAELTPQASYKIAAQVCGRRRYHERWQSLVAPYDLCLAWGRLASDEMEGQIKYSQDMRWVHFRMKRDAAVDVGYAASHSANVHVIYADDDLKKAVARLDEGDVVELTGYLVNLAGAYQGQKILWNSSLRRDDDGAGACEVLLLTSLRIGNKLYGRSID